jgi:hypothetical protein
MSVGNSVFQELAVYVDAFGRFAEIESAELAA